MTSNNKRDYELQTINSFYLVPGTSHNYENTAKKQTFALSMNAMETEICNDSIKLN
jgi:hypothetical protein